MYRSSAQSEPATYNKASKEGNFVAKALSVASGEVCAGPEAVVGNENLQRGSMQDRMSEVGRENEHVQDDLQDEAARGEVDCVSLQNAGCAHPVWLAELAPLQKQDPVAKILNRTYRYVFDAGDTVALTHHVWREHVQRNSRNAAKDSDICTRLVVFGSSFSSLLAISVRIASFARAFFCTRSLCMPMSNQ